MWAEKWQRSFNVTKCKKTHFGEIRLRILLTIVQPQPGKIAQMAENYSLKTERNEKKNAISSEGIGK